MTPWAPAPDLWLGKTVAILAGGPSLNQETADAVRGYVRIAINDSWRLAPDADMLYAADAAWWRRHPEALAFAGLKVCASDTVRLPGVLYCKPRRIPWGGNSALRAAHVASDAGAARILLLGVDLRDDAITHWHGLHKRLGNPTLQTFRIARKAWEGFAADKRRPEVFNCSEFSALTCFPFWDPS